MNAAYRQLTIFQSLMNGQLITKSELVAQFAVNPRVIQRDFSQLKQFIADQQLPYQLAYHRGLGGYQLTSQQDDLSKQTILVLIKVLLASRSLTKIELDQTITGLLKLIKPADRQAIEPIIKNEQFHYIPVHHQKPLLQLIWQFSQLILKKQTITIHYQRQHGEIVERTILPEAIICSEYYYYLISYNAKYQSNLFYRIDRIQDWHLADEVISRTYAQRFEDGPLRQNTHYMQPGKLTTIQFEFWGIVEAALDRFPNATIKARYPKRGSVLIETEAYDRGALMWLFSQGPLVKVVAPTDFVAMVKASLNESLKRN